jgi:RNA 3'-terminal phosphate cyclase (ATP)
MASRIRIDGAQGEGGGQILRSSLALSLLTAKPFHMERIRARRKKPGLLRQHLTAVQAAMAVGAAQVSGCAPGSQALTFTPAAVHPATYHFDIGSAGSCLLVLQTILPALLLAGAPSHVTLQGGTHNPAAPCFHFMDKVFLPLVNRMGPSVTAELTRWGFYPAGGGRVECHITPAAALAPLEIVRRGKIRHCALLAVVAHLPLHIAKREIEAFVRQIDWPAKQAEAREIRDSDGPGNVLLAEIHGEEVTELFTGFGRRGVPAEMVGRHLADDVRSYLNARAPVGPHLADQLLIPMAMAGRGYFRTCRPSNHTLTNMAVVQKFLDVRIAATPIDDQVWEIFVGS